MHLFGLVPREKRAGSTFSHQTTIIYAMLLAIYPQPQQGVFVSTITSTYCGVFGEASMSFRGANCCHSKDLYNTIDSMIQLGQQQGSK